MAGVIVPLVLAALPELLKVISPLISALVHQHAPVIEAQQGPGTGPVKIADLNLIVMAALIKAHAAGEITCDLPSPELVKVMVQTAVSSMKAAGMLKSPAPGSTGPQDITLGPGQIVTITRYAILRCSLAGAAGAAMPGGLFLAVRGAPGGRERDDAARHAHAPVNARGIGHGGIRA
jgi:hypothetical protein